MSTVDNSACTDCTFHNAEGLKKLGVETNNVDFVIALAGNPNTGKSTVFNSLTGLRQHTGNWPGKTVVRAEGAYLYAGRKNKLIDLPGTYSLLSTSEDEEVARNFILFGKPDVTIIVVDASRLERNLNLVLQVLEITSKVVICLNLMDEAERHGIEIDQRALARDLGVPVVATIARTEVGIPELISTIDEVATGKIVCKPHRVKNLNNTIEKAVSKLAQALEDQYPGLPNSRWLAFRLLEGDERISEAVESNELLELIGDANVE